MRTRKKIGLQILRWVVFAFAAFVTPATLYAQSCALCYQSVAASPSNFIQTLKGGIFVLILPSFLICTGVTILAYRKRNTGAQDESSAGE